MDLKTQILHERWRLFVDLKGGFTFPLAGALWWAGAAALGYAVPLKTWALYAFVGSGLIFPLAVLISKIFRVDVLGAKSSVDSVMGPAFIGMLLFWPMAFAAYWAETSLAPLILAIGMAMHWPVVGWTYGRSFLYSAHAVVRAIAVFVIWMFFPDHRTTWLPASVAIVYALTVVAIFLDREAIKKRLAKIAV